jgi:predicted Holliday junction resolvase-like endonuclease
LQKDFSKLADLYSSERQQRLEVKSGSARLNHNEHSLEDAIDNKRV